MSCLWGTSNKVFGDMNFYDRENDSWYDVKLKENFIQISRGKYVKPVNFFIKTHFETVTIDVTFEVYSYDSIGRIFRINFEKSDGKKL